MYFFFDCYFVAFLRTIFANEQMFLLYRYLKFLSARVFIILFYDLFFYFYINSFFLYVFTGSTPGARFYVFANKFPCAFNPPNILLSSLIIIFFYETNYLPINNDFWELHTFTVCRQSQNRCFHFSSAVGQLQ